MSEPTTLVDLLSNSLIHSHLAPYLAVSAVFTLAASSKSLRSLILGSPDTLRYFDLTTVKSAQCDYTPIDVGGNTWRSERMDEALTEDEFYSGPVRGIFSKLQRTQLLRNVNTLILDGMETVTADLVHDIVNEERFSVRILSIRDTKNMNESKLQQALKYACRPSRPADRPKLRGLYYFGKTEGQGASSRSALMKVSAHRMGDDQPRVDGGVMSSEGAQIGSEWNSRSLTALRDSATRQSEHAYYRNSGKLKLGFSGSTQPWAETLEACKGIIAFDAVLCRGKRHTSTPPDNLPVGDPGYWHIPLLAHVALGPTGCASCGTSPEGPAIWSQSPPEHLPLLKPVPLHTTSVKLAQRPDMQLGEQPLPLFARCQVCLTGRYCEKCGRWWCEDCYDPADTDKRIDFAQKPRCSRQR